MIQGYQGVDILSAIHCKFSTARHGCMAVSPDTCVIPEENARVRVDRPKPHDTSRHLYLPERPLNFTADERMDRKIRSSPGGESL